MHERVVVVVVVDVVDNDEKEELTLFGLEFREMSGTRTYERGLRRFHSYGPFC